MLENNRKFQQKLSLRKKTEDIKNGNYGQKNTITKIKDSVGGVNNRLEGKEERISKLEGRK